MCETAEVGATWEPGYGIEVTSFKPVVTNVGVVHGTWRTRTVHGRVWTEHGRKRS